MNLKFGDLVYSQLRGLGMFTGTVASRVTLYTITWFDTHEPVDYARPAVYGFRERFIQYRERNRV